MVVRGAKMLAPNWFGFVEISKDIYVDQAMPSPQRAEIIQTVHSAQTRVSQFFGDLKGHPKIFACSTEACFVANNFGSTPKGQAYGSASLMLSPRGQDIVIITHELTHIELHTRIGAFRSWRSIPSWFDEGLAVLVSKDPRYTEAAWRKATDNGRNAPKLEKIGGMLGSGGWLLGYGTARHAVGTWYSDVGHAGLMQLIAEVKNGTDFEAAFNHISSGTATDPALQQDAPQAVKP